MKSFSKLGIALAISFYACASQAQQIEFSRKAVDQATQFTYRWEDRLNTRHGIIISVLNEDITLHLNDPKMKIRPQDLRSWLFSHVRAVADAHSRDGYEIRVRIDGDMIRIEGSGPNQAELDKRVNEVKASNDKGLAELDRQSYFTMEDGSLRLDYREIVDNSAEILSPIAQSLRPSDADLRTSIGSYLAFLQSIPYDKLDGNEDFGLYTPMHMLITNRGDCESKQLALATMVRSQFPGTKMVVVGLVDHLITGIAMQPRPGDQTIMKDGVLYVLMDATGPGLSVVGYISDREKQRIREGAAVLYSI